MAIYVYEMEFFPVETGAIVVVPCDEAFGGATSGDDFADAVESAADWLRMTIEDYLIRDKPLPEASFGHKPQEPNGRVIILAIEASLDNIPAVTAAEATHILGVSSARVAQMCAANLLRSWKEGSRRMITLDSINARLAERPQAGRPRKGATGVPTERTEHPLAVAM